MSDDTSEGFIDLPEGEVSSVETLEVDVSTVPQYYPGVVKPGVPADQPTVYRLQHGDIHMIPGVFGNFNNEHGTMDADLRHEWMRRCEPEAPEDVNDKPDIQGWTYISDYTIHPNTPTHDGPHTYYIHARIRHDNRLQFGAFTEKHTGKNQQQIPLYRISENEESLLQSQLLHGDIVPPLRIAGKAEAEQMLLYNGKLVLAAAPKLIGCLMNVGNARVSLTYNKTTTYFLKTYYGHIWIYWGAIIDRVLYIVGIPLYQGTEKGTLVYSPGTDGKATRVSVKLPPTEDDLRSHFGGSVFVAEESVVPPNRGAFYRAVEMLWGISTEYRGGFESSSVKVDAFLAQYGDSATSIPLCKRALAVIKPGTSDQPTMTPLTHGDIYADTSLLGYDGGVYHSENKLLIRNELDVMTSFVEHDIQGGWPSESGASGFIPTMTRYDRLGHIRYAAQAFYAGQVGRNYFIRTVGCLRPYGAYDLNSILSGVDVALTRATEPEDGDDEEDSYWGGGGGSGGGGGGSDDDDDDDDDNGGIEDVGDVGIWWQAGDGMKVTARRDANATKIRYVFEVEVTDSFSYTQTLHFDVKPEFSVNYGKSYTVDNGAVTLTMWYYLRNNGTQVEVCNLTSKSNRGGAWIDNTHPESVREFSITGFRKVRAQAKFAVKYLTNYADPKAVKQDSNIIQLINTGKKKTVRVSIVYYDANNRKHRKRVKGTMRIYTIALQKANIRNILRNYPRLHTPVLKYTFTPESISGSTTGTAGAPTVTCHAVTATPIPLPTQGETEAKGPFPMHVSGYYEEMNTTISIANACTGWYEFQPSNRHSVTISGSFSINSPFQRF